MKLSPPARPVLAFLAAAAVLSLIGVNSGLLALAFVILFMIVLLLWHAKVPPALFLVCGAQWLQGALKLLDAEYLGRPLWKMSMSRSVEEASVLTMLWALALAIGMRVVLRGMKLKVDEPVLSVRAALATYLIWAAAMPFLGFITPDSGRQILVSLSALRMATIYAVFIAVLQRRRGYAVMAGVLAIEVLLGFLSFFSDFKTALLVMLLALMARTRRLSFVQVLGIAGTAAATIYLAVVWSAIKTEYRTVLSDGMHDQMIRIDSGQQLDALQKLMTNVDDVAFDKAFDALIERVAYVEYFAFTLDFIPRVRPHEDGRVWLGALEHVLLPRLLFPDKAALVSDTETTERFTGRNVNGNRRGGTSISIGLPAETYVDFGAPFMFVPALLLGAVLGLTFRILVTRPQHATYGAGFAVGIALQHLFVELTAAKTLGSLVATIIVATAVWLLLLPRLLAMSQRLLHVNLGPDRRGTIQLPPA